ncbi:MAG: imidazoleglycerol-phosphate dehydratase HisB [Balneolaceae bacterium]|nr:imidazoleglycerol-phosphate dehydratase HisB [Balneolaceae bacterium]
MKIWIETAGLRGKNDRLLRHGLLYSVHRLRKAGYQLGFVIDELSEAQQELLDNDGVEPAFTNSGEAGGKIFLSADEKLKLTVDGEPLAEASDWISLTEKWLFPQRSTGIKRSTSETDIEGRINLDGSGKAEISTGIGFFDHMLEQIARHGLVDIELHCDGDLEVDEHHTIEDVAIALGTAVDEALGKRMGIQRYGFVLPMDESKATVTLDFSGRPFLKFEASFDREMVGEFPTEMTEHFFYSLAINMKATLHIEVEGSNDHHKIEACFKGFGRCLRTAVSRSERMSNILPSTKEKL